MNKSGTDKYSAPEQGLGYIYQPRLALLRLFDLPEETTVYIEKDDDLDFVDTDGTKSLASLKHKAEGDRLADLSVDFWKSVRIWLTRYKSEGCLESSLRFFLFTTGLVSTNSFLTGFLPSQTQTSANSLQLAETAVKALGTSKSKLSKELIKEFNELQEEEIEDFFDRITIFDSSPRISEIPDIIKDKLLRTVRRNHRDAVFERLEGWWNQETIMLLSGNRTNGLTGYEVSDKLSNIAEEYHIDNLPITFRKAQPDYTIDVENDPRTFVKQLRYIGISHSRIQNAIIDYYRAYEQRSEWARENLIVHDELEEYEERLESEWSRYRDVVLDDLPDFAEKELKKAGREIYKWADQESGNIENLRIRARVTEPYVTRGSLHMLANATPEPKIYWHPNFLTSIKQALEIS